MDATRKKKILYVITKSNWGGAQRYVYDLATNLPKDHFEVAVALGGQGLLEKRLESAQIRVIPLTSVQRDLSVAADTAGFGELYRILKSFNPDVVHLNSSKAAGLGALAARLIGIPRIIFTVHGWPFEERRNIAWRLFAFLGSWATALFSHQVVVVSNYDLRIAKKMGFGYKTIQIYNGINLHMPLGSGEQIRSVFPPGVKITGTVGELIRNKNQTVLIEQARKDPGRYIAIVGEGEDRTSLETKIKEYELEERVKLFGFMPADEVLQGFDIFALPSLKEGLPYVLLEARAAGLPIEANRVGGVSEILDAPDMSEFSLDKMLEKTIDIYSK